MAPAGRRAATRPVGSRRRGAPRPLHLRPTVRGPPVRAATRRWPPPAYLAPTPAPAQPQPPLPKEERTRSPGDVSRSKMATPSASRASAAATSLWAGQGAGPGRGPGAGPAEHLAQGSGRVPPSTAVFSGLAVRRVWAGREAGCPRGAAVGGLSSGPEGCCWLWGPCHSERRVSRHMCAPSVMFGSTHVWVQVFNWLVTLGKVISAL